jgi:hypothetical protein
MPLPVYYDTRLNPVTFDFANFLINAEASRQFTPYTSISLSIIAPSFRQFSKRDLEYEESEKRWRLHHILGQIPKLLPTVVKMEIQQSLPNHEILAGFPPNYPDAINKDRRDFYSPAIMLQLFDKGANLQQFRASEHAKTLVRTYTRGHAYVTISLRTSQFQAVRNSNLKAWYKLSLLYKEKGIRVLVIPDFEDCFNERLAWKYDWDVVDFAAHDLDLRLALYEDASDNFTVNNGVVTTLFYSKCSFKMFNVGVPALQTTNEKFISKHWQVEFGKTPRIFQENQEWIWQEDTLENLIAYIDV